MTMWMSDNPDKYREIGKKHYIPDTGKIFLLITILLGCISWCPAVLSHYNLYVVLTEDNPARIFQLKVLPNGQIIDPHIQYTLVGIDPSDIEVTNDYRFLYVLANEHINWYQIQADGNLYSLGSTNMPNAGFTMAITPNNQMMLVTGFGESSIYTISSTGDLVNDIAGPLIAHPKIDPLGRGMLAQTIGNTFSAFTLSYATRTFTITTSFPNGGAAYQLFNFTSDGKVGFFYGNGVYPQRSSSSLWVLSIDSNFQVSTTSQIFDTPIVDLVVSKDNKYFWTPTGYYIELFTVDSVGKVTDTGQRYYVLDTTLGTSAFHQRNTLDDSLAVVSFDDFRITPGGSFATAWIGGDGSLHWTGSTYAFDSAYPSLNTIGDFLIVPVYSTGVEKELWDDSPPEFKLNSSKEINLPENP